MTLTELKQFSEQCKTDAEFLEHLEVMLVYWKAMRHIDNGHSRNTMTGVCYNCGKHWMVFKDEACIIQCFLADAVENLRVNVMVMWHDPAVYRSGYLAAEKLGWFEACDNLRAMVVSTTLRDRFMVFAAALQAVEVA
jgi:hypothetical protein